MMKNVKVTINSDKNNVVLNGESDMIVNQYGLVDVILDIDTNLITNFGNIREVKNDIELLIIFYDEYSILYSVKGEIDGQIETFFDGGKFNGEINHTSQEEFDNENFKNRKILKDNPLFKTLEKRAIRDYKDLYPNRKGVESE